MPNETSTARAGRDPLTGLPGRDELAARLDCALRGVGRGISSVTLFAVDVRGLRAINERAGRDEGDRVLAAVAGSLRTGAGPATAVARIGGGEFAVLCVGIGREVAERIACRLLRCALGSNGDRGPVGVSIGVVHVDRPGADAASVLDRADWATYQAKAGGRDRFELIGPRGRRPRRSSGEAA